jgi:hypothetical protein
LGQIAKDLAAARAIGLPSKMGIIQLQAEEAMWVHFSRAATTLALAIFSRRIQTYPIPILE